MTEIQEKLMVLMDEIMVICKEEKLRFVLADQTAILAATKQKFSNSFYEFQILMPLQDVLKLKSRIESNGRTDRAFESWEDNYSLDQMVFRYVDKESFIYDVGRGRFYSKPGVAVTIFVAKAKKPSASIQGAERYLQMYNEGRKESFWIAETKKKHVGKSSKNEENADEEYNTYKIHCGGMRAFFMGKQKLAQYVLENESADCENAGKSFWFMKFNGELCKIGNIFDSPKQITFENRKFPMPKNTEKYLEDVENYLVEMYNNSNITDGVEVENSVILDNLNKLSLSNRFRVIADANLAYETYLDFANISYEELRSAARYQREYLFWKTEEHDPAEQKASHTFSRIKRTVDRIDLNYQLKSKREALAKAYESKNIGDLKKLLKTYLDKTEDYRIKGIGFYIDKELFDYARLIWDKEKPEGYAEEIYSLVPDLYKKESVDDYLKGKAVLRN